MDLSPFDITAFYHKFVIVTTCNEDEINHIPDKTYPAYFTQNGILTKTIPRLINKISKPWGYLFVRISLGFWGLR